MSDEFPLLEGLGLYASDIIGDGDCLFRSFSDQLYGHQDKAHEIRRRTTSYMREHSDYFKLFLSVAPPKKSKANNTKAPTEDAIDRAFLQHVARMEKSGVYGDNLEIVAFARCYTVNVKIYQREFAYQISCSDSESESSAAQLLHIAYHNWEHYSSVRNVDGPHTGLPNVNPKPMTAEGERKQKEVLEKGVVIMPWMEKVVTASLPGFVEKEKVRQMLEKCKGDVNLAVSKLLDEVEDEEQKLAESEEVAVVKKEEEKNGLTDKPASDVSSKGTVGGKAQKKGPGNQADSDKTESSGKKQSNQQNRPKRETARDRKERQKRENMERKKAKSSGSNAASNKAAPTSAATVEEGIKTLHV